MADHLPAVYTFGYSGHEPNQLARFVEAQDALLLDIRLRPLSRSPQWSKKNLIALFGERYRHAGGLGNVNYKGGPIQLADPQEWFEKIGALLRDEGRSVVLMCVCRDFTTCHRRVVAAELAGRGLASRELVFTSATMPSVPS